MLVGPISVSLRAPYHCSDVIMGAIAAQITSLMSVTQPFIQAQIKENFKVPRHWLLCGEFAGDCEFPAQRASNAENVSIWCRHHGNFSKWYELNHPFSILCDGCHVWPICHVWRMSCVTDVKCDGCHVWRMPLYTHSLAAVPSKYLGHVTNNQPHGAQFIFKSHKISFVHKSHFCLWIISKCFTERHNMTMELEIQRGFGDILSYTQ